MSNAFARIIGVALLASWTLCTTVPSVAVLWLPQGSIGLRADYDGRIMQVDPNGPAARAGIAAGDQIDLGRTPMRYRSFASPSAPWPKLGETVWLGIKHGSDVRLVALAPVVHALPTAERWSIVARIFDVLVFVFVGSFLVLVRPSKATWGFFLSCLGINPPPPATLGMLPFSWALAVQIGAHVLFAAGATGFLIFALRFPRHETFGWRQRIERFALPIFVITAALFVYPDVAAVAFGLPSETIQALALAWASAIALVVVAALFGTYIYGSADDRQRMRWVLVGFAVGVSAGIAAGVLGYSSLLPVQASTAAVNILLFLTAAVPATVAYAVIRHRVLDIRFAVSRALVYGSITSGAIVVFGIIDWFFAHVLAAAGWAMVVEIGASIGLGFGLNSLQLRVDTIVDRLFFRARHAAEKRLARIAAALPGVGSINTVDELLVGEPQAAWQLSSAAIFRRNAAGQLVRSAAVGWQEQALPSLDPDDSLCLQLQSENAPLRLTEIGWSRPELPSGAAQPVLGVPILVRRTLLAVALYGAPLSGEDFDPDQFAILCSLAIGAAAAYDHLEAAALQRRVEELERLLQLQDARLPLRG